MRKTLNGFLVTGVVLTAMPDLAMGASPFGSAWTESPSVVAQLSQVVFYRPQDKAALKGAANIYINREFHTALLPGGYTSFCMKPGVHILGAAIGDQPLYRGKNSELFEANLKGGQTYFLRVEERRDIRPPYSVKRKQGESEVKKAHEQIHLFSRASTVRPCVYDGQRQQGQVYMLSTPQLLSRDEHGIVILSEEGRQQLRELAIQLRQRHPGLERVTLTGHLAGKHEAVLIGKVLAESAIHVDSAYSRDSSASRSQEEGGVELKLY